MHIYIYIYMYVYIHIYIYIYVYVCVCVYIYIYIYIYLTGRLGLGENLSPSSPPGPSAAARHVDRQHGWNAALCVSQRVRRSICPSLYLFVPLFLSISLSLYISRM